MDDNNVYLLASKGLYKDWLILIKNFEKEY